MSRLLRRAKAFAHATALPRFAPMLLTSSAELSDDDHRWAYEVKYDGWRVLVYIDRGELRLMSRNARDLTELAPELRALGAALRRRRLVLDGELVVLDENGRPIRRAAGAHALSPSPPSLPCISAKIIVTP